MPFEDRTEARATALPVRSAAPTTIRRPTRVEPAPGGRRAGEEGVTADCLVEGISDPLLAEHVVAEIGASGDTGPTTAGEPAIGVRRRRWRPW
jgi:hypothetical protein